MMFDCVNTASILFQKYNQFLLAAKEAMEKYIAVYCKSANDVLDFSSVSALLEVIVSNMR